MTISIQIKPKYWGAYESPGAVYSKTSILNQYSVKLSLSLEGGLTWADRAKLWLSAALFLPLNDGFDPYGGEPKHGFHIQLPDLSSVVYGTTVFEMNFKSASSVAQVNAYNGRATIILTSDSTADVYYDFYQVADTGNYQNDKQTEPPLYYLNSHLEDSQPLRNFLPSVYTTVSELSFYAYYQNGSATDYLDQQLPYQSRFYAEGLRSQISTPAVPEFASPQIILLDAFDQPVTSLSVNQNYRLMVTTGSSPVPLYALFYAIEVRDSYESVSPFFMELPLTTSLLTSSGGTAEISGPITQPSQNWILNVGNYEAWATLLGSNLTQGASYRFVAVIANNDYSNTIISEAIPVNAIPSAVPVLNIETSLNDYVTEIGDYAVNSAVVDRMISRSSLSQADYSAAAIIYSPNGNLYEDLTSITITLKDKDSGVIYDSGIITKSGTTYLSNNPRFIPTANGNDISTYYLWRNGYLNEQLLVDVGGRTLQVLYQYRFFYAGADLIVIYEKTQEVEVSDFENFEASPFVSAINYYDPSGNPLSSVCDPDLEYVKVEVVLADPNDNGVLLAYIDQKPYGITMASDIALQGEASFTFGIMPQESSDLLFDVEWDFVLGKASFKVDLKKLNLSRRFRVYAVIKEFCDAKVLTFTTSSQHSTISQSGEIIFQRTKVITSVTMSAGISAFFYSQNGSAWQNTLPINITAGDKFRFYVVFNTGVYSGTLTLVE